MKQDRAPVGATFVMKARRRFVQTANGAESSAMQLEELARVGEGRQAARCRKLARMLREVSTAAMLSALDRYVSDAIEGKSINARAKPKHKPLARTSTKKSA